MSELHPLTAKLIDDFSSALKAKLAKAQEKHGYSIEWMDPKYIGPMRYDMMNHLLKGDPLDVAAYCAFLWYHGVSTVTEVVQNVPANNVPEGKKP